MHHRIVWGAVWLIVAALAAGCGSGDGADSTPPTTGAPATTRAPETTSPEMPVDSPAPPADPAPPETAPPGEGGPTMEIFTSAFEDGGEIPAEYTCDGANRAPGVRFDAVPPGTTSLALTVIDPDGGDWIHWVAWGIRPSDGGLPADAPAGDLPGGIRQGANDYARSFSGGDRFPGGGAIRIDGWDGPCPPSGEHRYVFTLFALEGSIDLPSGTPGAEVLTAIEAAAAAGGVLAEATLVGTYRR